MPQRTQITLPSDDHRRARVRAHDRGISLAEYVRQLVARDLSGDSAPRSSPEDLFDLGSSQLLGGGDVASQKDAYVGHAISAGRSARGGA